LSFGEQPHPTSPLREEWDFTEGLSACPAQSCGVRRGTKVRLLSASQEKIYFLYFYIYLIAFPFTDTFILDFNLEIVVYHGGLMVITKDEISG
jgi:hypothetical protein